MFPLTASSLSPYRENSTFSWSSVEEVAIVVFLMRID